MKKSKNSDSLFKFLEKRIECYRQQGNSRGTKVNATLNRLKDFRNGVDLPLKEFNKDFVRGFKEYLEGEGLMPNTVGFYLRCLRIEYRKAVDMGMTDDSPLFVGLGISREKAVKQPLTLSDIRAIRNIDLSGDKRLALARDMFMFSFYAQGMELVDMAFLRMENIRNGQVTFRRHRSGQQESVAWLPEMQAIIDRYPDNPTGYLLPIIDSKKDHSDEKRFKLRAHTIYVNLKTVAQMADVKAAVTPDIARITWDSLFSAAMEQAKTRLLMQIGA